MVDAYSQNKTKKHFSFGDTVFLERPIHIGMIGSRSLILLNVDNLESLKALVDTSNYKKSFKKIKKRYKYKYYIHSLLVNGILMHYGIKTYIPEYIYEPIERYKMGELEFDVLGPCNMVEFSFKKKSELGVFSTEYLKRKHFLFGSTKYGVLFF